MILDLFAPYTAEDMWQRLGYEPSVALVPWRKADPALLVEESVTAIVQVDGKVRDRLEVSPKISADELESLARASAAVVAIGRRSRDRQCHRARTAPREHRHPGLIPTGYGLAGRGRATRPRQRVGRASVDSLADRPRRRSWPRIACGYARSLRVPIRWGRSTPVPRRASPRLRVTVGAAVALFIGAVAVAAILSFTATGGGGQGPSAGRSPAMPRARPALRPPRRDGAVSGAPLLVHVLGAVARPGLVELEAGARVVDAVAAAGGLTPEADPAGVNLARPVVDGEQLVVPVVGAAPPPEAAGGAAAAADGLVHLNTADVAELDTLPRIGPALAQRIIDWRDANGPFTSTEQLLDVAGIGDAVFAGLADKVAP